VTRLDYKEGNYTLSVMINLDKGKIKIVSQFSYNKETDDLTEDAIVVEVSGVSQYGMIDAVDCAKKLIGITHGEQLQSLFSQCLLKERRKICSVVVSE